MTKTTLIWQQGNNNNMAMKANKPFKYQMHNLYLDWLMKHDADMPTCATSWVDMSIWIVQAVKNIPVRTVKNAWRKRGYSYFE